MNAIKGQFSWKRAAAVGVFLLLLPLTLLYAEPGPAPPAQVSFEFSSWTYNEYDGTVTITVLMDGAPTAPVSVRVSTGAGGTATAGVDYQTNSQVLVWQPSEAGTAKTFTIVIIDDSEIEPTETVNLILSELSSNAVFGTYSTAVLNILDDDAPCPLP